MIVDSNMSEEDYYRNPILRAISSTEGSLIALLSFWIILSLLLYFDKLSETSFVQLFLTSSIVYPLLRKITE